MTQTLLEPKPPIGTARDDADEPGFIDARAASRGATRRTLIGCLLFVTGASVWAFLPLTHTQVPPLPSHDSAAGAVSESAPTKQLDPRAFDAPLWAVAPKPPEPPKPAAAPPPFKLQLVGITASTNAGMTETFQAAFYDPDTDRIVLVRNGDTVVQRKVESITQTKVRLTLGQSVQELSTLDTKQGGTP